MATSGRNPHANEEEKYFRYMWLDANVYNEDNKIIQRQLSDSFGRCKFVETIQECRTAIHQAFDNTNFVLIVSGQFGSQLVPIIHPDPKICAIYVYCGNVDSHKKWADNFEKVKYVTNDSEQLINKMKTDKSSW